MKKSLLAIMALTVTNSMAYSVAVGKVTAIDVNPNSVLVEWSPNISNNDNCTHPYSDHTFILPLTNETKGQYTALLSASISGKKARVLYEGCLGALPKIIRVDILSN